MANIGFTFNTDEWLIKMAKEGYREYQNKLVQRCRDEIHNAKFSSEVIQNFLVSAFDEIAKGKDVRKALLQMGDVSGKRTKSLAGDQLDLDIAVDYYAQTFLKVPRKTKGGLKPKTKKQIRKELSQKYGKGDSTLKTIINKNKAAAKELYEQEIETAEQARQANREVLIKHVNEYIAWRIEGPKSGKPKTPKWIKDYIAAHSAQIESLVKKSKRMLKNEATKKKKK